MMVFIIASGAGNITVSCIHLLIFFFGSSVLFFVFRSLQMVEFAGKMIFYKIVKIS